MGFPIFVRVLPPPETLSLRCCHRRQLTQSGAPRNLCRLDHCVSIHKGSSYRFAAPYGIDLDAMVIVFHIISSNRRTGREVHHFSGGCVLHLPFDEALSMVFSVGTPLAGVIGINIRLRRNVGCRNTLPQRKRGRGVAAEHIGNAVVSAAGSAAADKVQAVAFPVAVQRHGQGGIFGKHRIFITNHSPAVRPGVGGKISIGIFRSNIRHIEFRKRNAVLLQRSPGRNGKAAQRTCTCYLISPGPRGIHQFPTCDRLVRRNMGLAGTGVIGIGLLSNSKCNRNTLTGFCRIFFGAISAQWHLGNHQKHRQKQGQYSLHTHFHLLPPFPFVEICR